jgi:hypothetical protein
VPHNQRPAFLQNRESEGFFGKIEKLQHFPLSVCRAFCFGLSEFLSSTFRMAADHGEFAFRSPHQPMQICDLGRYACGKTTGCESPTMVEAFWVEFDYKREEAFAQSG